MKKRLLIFGSCLIIAVSPCFVCAGSIILCQDAEPIGGPSGSGSIDGYMARHHDGDYTMNDIVIASVAVVEDGLKSPGAKAGVVHLSATLTCEDYHCRPKSLRTEIAIEDHCPFNGFIREYRYTRVSTSFDFDFDRNLLETTTQRTGKGGRIINYTALGINLDEAIQIASDGQKNNSGTSGNHFVVISLSESYSVILASALHLPADFRFEINPQSGKIIE